MRLLFAVILLSIAADTATVAAASQAGERVVVVVNGKSIFQRELNRLIPSGTVSAAKREQALQKLIDQTLVAAELKRLKVKADPEILDKNLRFFLDSYRKAGKDPKRELKKAGHTIESLKAEIARTLAWRRHARDIIPAEEIRAVFKKERSRYDGTRLRARQIVLKLPPNADAQTKQRLIGRLTAIRREIASGKTTFTAAAKLHSTSPSKNKGGDLGYFTYGSSRLSVHLSRIAFSLKGKEISEPTVTPFGVHILQVTDRKPGQLSLEDVRPEILKRLSDERWKFTVKKLRATAKIERK